jgi:hypothetical protein
LRGNPFGKGLDKNELLLRKAHFFGDVSKLVTFVANFTFKSSFTTQILHLEAEEVFGSTKHIAYFLSSAYDESHRLDCFNFSRPRVVVPTCQPNNVDNLSIPKSPCVAQNMFPTLFQGGVTINEIMCGDGIWNIDRCPPSSVV